MKIITAIVITLGLAATAAAGHFHSGDFQYGWVHCPSCGGRCVLQIKQVKEKESYFDIEKEQVCIPSVRFPWETGPRCPGRTRMVNRLVSKTREKPETHYEWVAVCPYCGRVHPKSENEKGSESQDAKGSNTKETNTEDAKGTKPGTPPAPAPAPAPIPRAPAPIPMKNGEARDNAEPRDNAREMNEGANEPEGAEGEDEQTRLGRPVPLTRDPFGPKRGEAGRTGNPPVNPFASSRTNPFAVPAPRSSEERATSTTEPRRGGLNGRAMTPFSQRRATAINRSAVAGRTR